MKRFSWLPLLLFTASVAGELQAEGIPSEVEAAERRRIAIVERITPATIAIFNDAGDNGGSGVIISADGYALTNFHVVAPCGPFMDCGLPDGTLVKAVLIGLDPTGDIALIRLLDQSDYPAAVIGDSATTAVGDEVFVVGNPFLLADDFRPTVTHGILSGTRRYQYPAGGVLEYADCLQTDAAINPGNSGGPLYDRDGKLIGINGRGSFEKRGRVNVGVGYAVSINQVMRFVELLKTGRVVDHGSLGATARTTADGRVLITAVSRSSDAYRRGLRFGDRVLAIDGRPVTSANALMNAVATRPAAWRTKITHERSDGRHDTWVRLEPRHPGSELEQVVEGQLAQPKSEGEPSAERQDLYRHRPGYANHAVTRQETQRVMAACPNRGGPTPIGGWRIQAEDAAGETIELLLRDERSEATLPAGRNWIETSRPFDEQPGPPGSGGLLVALHAWRQFVLASGPELDRFELHGPTPWGDMGALADRLVAKMNGVRIEYYLQRPGGKLIAIEAWLDDGADPCRLEFSRFGEGPAALGSAAPGVLSVWRGEESFARWSLTEMREADAGAAGESNP